MARPVYPSKRPGEFGDFPCNPTKVPLKCEPDAADMSTFWKTTPRWGLAALLSLFVTGSVAAPSARDLDTPRTFPAIGSKQEWQKCKERIRMQALVSCGLWPLPERAPLQAQVFDRVERDGYSVEKVYFQSYPGVYVGGNLYRPLGKGKGPFPGVLNPHGHWSAGRMADEKDGSLAGRCIGLARMGLVAFSYDMSGYNDTFFPDHGSVPADRFYVRHRRFATNAVHQLWGISQMGLQTWNSIRALDFLESLPDVDRKRLACTGESGGGTQTFMLGAIESRLAAVAPVVMVSHSMQGGCSCENAPGLRVEHSNMEISAAAVPIPQILVGATGDWTKTTLTVEGPAVARIYELMGVPERIRYVRFDFNHNYNQTSRESVYGWFNRWLLRARSFEAVPEQPFAKEPDGALRVFPDDKLPPDAITENQFIQFLISTAEAQWRQSLPTSRATLVRYHQLMLPAWQRALQLDAPEAKVPFVPKRAGTQYVEEVQWAGSNSQTGLKLAVNRPGNSAQTRVAILAGGDGAATSMLPSLSSRLRQDGWTVVEVKEFTPEAEGDPFANFYTVYNRTRAQERVRDLVRACQFARSDLNARAVVLCGTGAAGPWALLASHAADAVLADANRVDTSTDSELLAPDLFLPGLQRLGGFQGAALLGAPNPLFLHNTGPNFATAELRQSYQDLRAGPRFHLGTELATVDQMATWAASLR